MFGWFRKKPTDDALPEYTRLRATPTRELPPALREREASDAYRASVAAIQEDLLRPGRRPPDDVPAFTTLRTGKRGIVVLTLPEGPCAMLFTQPTLAFDYARTALPPRPPVQYMMSSTNQVLNVARGLQDMGIPTAAVDRCPRCSIVLAITLDSLVDAESVHVVRAVAEASRLARADLYLGAALEAARSGRFAEARDIALETVGHVTMEDPRAHVLLASVAKELTDPTLETEAQAFLRFLGVDAA